MKKKQKKQQQREEEASGRTKEPAGQEQNRIG